MRCNLVKKFVKGEAKDGKQVVFTNFYLKFDNGTTIAIRPTFLHQKDNDKLPSRDVLNLSALADRLDGGETSDK